jgi:hypothetical protein
MLNEIITIYAITDDLLRTIGHKEDCRRNINDIMSAYVPIVGSQFCLGWVAILLG